MTIPSLDKTKSVLVIGAAIAGVYIAWQIFKLLREGTQFAGDTLQAAQTQTTNLLEYFVPLTNPNQFITYAVRFPEDGLKHAVNGEDIDSAGRFWRNGTHYQLTTDSAGNKVAQLLPGKTFDKTPGK